MYRIFWSSAFRFAAFWAIAIGVIYVASLWLPWFDLTLISTAFEGIAKGIAAGNDEMAIATARDHDFIYSLALLIFFTGLGLLVAFFVMHTLAVTVSLLRMRRLLSSRDSSVRFARDYEVEILPRLLRHRLIGAAWKEFDETLLKGKVEAGGPIQNTIRPQSFINYGLVREKLPGLKVIGSVSGYFVGVGLLLTFIGIVLARSRQGREQQRYRRDEKRDVQPSERGLIQVRHVDRRTLYVDRFCADFKVSDYRNRGGAGEIMRGRRASVAIHGSTVDHGRNERGRKGATRSVERAS
ncbi:hypothetical protein ACFX5Q_07070 [Mesorhizobium sp. IMUNJ 23033]|uniref:hypothetical protein n=1 Tax=Mesorhizobium sp. IMUNJ 23033 TaxID=3378039 RepID=UPI00384C612A